MRASRCCGATSSSAARRACDGGIHAERLRFSSSPRVADLPKRFARRLAVPQAEIMTKSLLSLARRRSQVASAPVRSTDRLGYTAHMSDVTRLEPDPVVDAYKKDVDRTLIRERLSRTPEQRLRDLQSLVRSLVEL